MPSHSVPGGPARSAASCCRAGRGVRVGVGGWATLGAGRAVEYGWGAVAADPGWGTGRVAGAGGQGSSVGVLAAAVGWSVVEHRRGGTGGWAVEGRFGWSAEGGRPAVGSVLLGAAAGWWWGLHAGTAAGWAQGAGRGLVPAGGSAGGGAGGVRMPPSGNSGGRPSPPGPPPCSMPPGGPVGSAPGWRPSSAARLAGRPAGWAPRRVRSNPSRPEPSGSWQRQ